MTVTRFAFVPLDVQIALSAAVAGLIVGLLLGIAATLAAIPPPVNPIAAIIMEAPAT